MKKIIILLSALAVVSACVKEERMAVQDILIPGSDKETELKADYYKALREYKESDHILSYVFMGRYATLEGAVLFK